MKIKNKIKISVNGKQMLVISNFTIKSLITKLKLPLNKIAIELNKKIIDKKRISTTQLKKGDTLVVLGASGSTGVAAIQIGKIMGAKVIAASSSIEKQNYTKSLGADITIGYENIKDLNNFLYSCLLYTSPSQREGLLARMTSSD